MSYVDDTDPRWSDASRARHPYDAAPEPYPTAEPYAAADPYAAGSDHGEYAEPGYGDPSYQQTARAGRRRRDELPAGGPQVPAPTGPDYGRAGRNVPLSLAVGVAMLAVVLVPLFYAKPFFLLVLLVAAGVGVWEMVRAVRASGAQPPLIPLLGGSVAMLSLGWFSGIDALSIGLLVTVLATMVWRMGDGPVGYQRDMGAAALILVYVPFLLGFAAPLTVPDDGAWRIVVVLAAVVLSDTGGFVAGVLFGRHPMAPSISPKKSWEGFAGSLLACGVGSAVLLWLLFDVKPWWGVLFGVVMAIAAVLGDLAESLLKRDLGIKDMSNLLPGHGGLMDRLDSVLFAVPTAYLLLSVLAPVS